jgi:hypothetical protein
MGRFLRGQGQARGVGERGVWGVGERVTKRTQFHAQYPFIRGCAGYSLQKETQRQKTLHHARTLTTKVGCANDCEESHPPQPIFPQLSHHFPLPNTILYLGVPCALVKLME